MNHDVDDAIRAGIILGNEFPKEISDTIGESNSERINSLILDMIDESKKSNVISFSPSVLQVFNLFYSYVYENIYTNIIAKSEESKVYGIIRGLFDYYYKNPDELPDDYRLISQRDGKARAVSDYISGMTDKYSIHIYEELFIPDAWQVR
jgi:dGTPase